MYKILFLVSAILFLVGCASQVAFTTKKANDVDSQLFYQQKDVKEPFLDSLLTNPGNSALLTTTLLPPPPPPPDSMKQIEGFRIQAFAGLDSVKAFLIKEKLKSLSTAKLYIFKENGLFKVQAGDFLYRNIADSVQRHITIQDFPGTWVVKRLVNVRIENPEPVSEVVSTEVNYKFKIQILATADESRAMGLISELQEKFIYPSYYLPAGTLFKVYVGKFVERNEADTALGKVRGSGYPDAWLVY